MPIKIDNKILIRMNDKTPFKVIDIASFNTQINISIKTMIKAWRDMFPIFIINLR